MLETEQVVDSNPGSETEIPAMLTAPNITRTSSEFSSLGTNGVKNMC